MYFYILAALSEMLLFSLAFIWRGFVSTNALSCFYFLCTFFDPSVTFGMLCCSKIEEDVQNRPYALKGKAENHLLLFQFMSNVEYSDKRIETDRVRWL